MSDPRQREPRTFQCRPALWQRFAELAERMDCSVDFLINDAMRLYARRLQERPAPSPSVRRGPRTAPPQLLVETRPPPPPRRTEPRSLPPPLPAEPRALPPPPPPRRSSAPRSLRIEYGAQGFPVTRPRFVIGRGKRVSDFVIKDPNVSRQHAVIEQRGFDYYVVDLGSTNGVLVDGARVHEHRIADGDVIEICGHTLRLCLS
jgi:hypothetical protein